MSKPALIIFASGTKEGGGSGALNLIQASRDGRLNADIVAVVSTIKGGGVERKLEDLRTKEGVTIPFVHFPREERTPEGHERLARDLGGEECYIALSGCLWLVAMKDTPHDERPGLDPRRTFNIHPGSLTMVDPSGKLLFGGAGMWGRHVHERVMKMYKEKIPQKGGARVLHTAVTMHFVTKKYDDGPVFFELPIDILPTDTPESLGEWVHKNEHRFQPYITDAVVNGRISWDGSSRESLSVPLGYPYLPKVSRKDINSAKTVVGP